jgi:NodT family efflux transporter outer membrane factor (OMF) lipoprotein
VAGLLAGCDLGPAYHPETGPVPDAFRAAPAADTAVWPDKNWWRGFSSPDLSALIEAAQAHNLDIAAAVARIRQADAQLRIAGAPLLPNLNGTGGASWQHEGLGTNGASTLSSRSRSGSVDLHSYNVGLNASYELDFWGKNLANRQSALSSAMFSRYDRQTVALTAVTNVASTWFNALAFADRLQIAERNLDASMQTLAVIRGRREAGTASDLDVAQQETFVATSRAAVPNLRNQLEQAVIGLGILTGQPPESVKVAPGSLDTLALPPVSPGLPSELLLRRPDVASAEATLMAKNFNIKAARAAFFPSVQLTGSDGFQAASLSTLIGPAGALISLGVGLTAPIFDGGTLRGQLELAKGQYDEQLATYQKAVLQAFTDVDNALTAWRYTTQQQALQQVAVDQARRAASIARAQMAAGTVDITTVLTTETTLLNNEDTLAQVHLARVQALLSLYQALGGGWQKPENDPHPGLSPGILGGAVALPVGGNLR